MFAKTDVKIIGRKTVYQGYMKIDEWCIRHPLYRGGTSEILIREALDRGDAVAVLPYDPARDAVVLIEQFRIGPFARDDHPWCLEIIAGIIEPGEAAKTVAHREAAEEAGLTLDDLVPVLTYYSSPGAVTETIAVYCGRVDSRKAGGIHGLAGEGEDIRALVMPFGDAMDALADGRIATSPAVIALQWLALHRDRLRAEWAAPAA